MIHLPQSPPATSASVRASMRGNRSSRTKPELLLVQALAEAGVSGFVSNEKELPGAPDIAFADARVVVFVHGCFWHRCPYCSPHFPDTNQDYWTAKFARNKARDKRVKAKLRASGIKAVVVWECQLKKNPRRVIRRIAKALEASRG